MPIITLPSTERSSAIILPKAALSVFQVLLGAASKEQVAIILKKLLRLEELPRRLDATDGLAVAVCHFFQSAPVPTLESRCRKKALGGGPASVSWERFISDHPERVKK